MRVRREKRPYSFTKFHSINNLSNQPGNSIDQTMNFFFKFYDKKSDYSTIQYFDNSFLCLYLSQTQTVDKRNRCWNLKWETIFHNIWFNRFMTIPGLIGLLCIYLRWLRSDGVDGSHFSKWIWIIYICIGLQFRCRRILSPSRPDLSPYPPKFLLFFYFLIKLFQIVYQSLP